MDSNATNIIYGLPVAEADRLVCILCTMSAAQKDALIVQIKEQHQRISYDAEEKNILLREAILQARGEQRQPLSRNELEILYHLLEPDRVIGHRGFRRHIGYDSMEWAVQANDIEATRLLIRTHFNEGEWENEPIRSVTFPSVYGFGLRAVRANDATEEMRRAVYEEYSRTRKLATRSLYYVLSRCWEEGSHREIRYFFERGADIRTINRYMFCWLLDFGADDQSIPEVAASLEVLLEIIPGTMVRLFTPAAAVSVGEPIDESEEAINPKSKFLEIIERLWAYDTDFISLFFRLKGQKSFFMNYMLWYAITEAIAIKKESDAGTKSQLSRPFPKRWRPEYDEKIAFLLENSARLAQKDYARFRDEFRKGNLPQSIALQLKKHGYSM